MSQSKKTPTTIFYNLSEKDIESNGWTWFFEMYFSNKHLDSSIAEIKSLLLKIMKH